LDITKTFGLGGAVLDRAWHFRAFFNSQDEEHRVPLYQRGFRTGQSSNIVPQRRKLAAFGAGG
jgi:hypothetical protein